MPRPLQTCLFGEPDTVPEPQQRAFALRAGVCRDETFTATADRWARAHGATILGYAERAGLVGAVPVVRLLLADGSNREASIDELRVKESA